MFLNWDKNEDGLITRDEVKMIIKLLILASIKNQVCIGHALLGSVIG